MEASAIFRRKEPCYEPRQCEIEKVIRLTDSEYATFRQNLLADYDFIQENRDLMRVENGITHCLLVVGETFPDGILVNSEGSSYARYSAYFSGAQGYLLTHGQVQTEAAHTEVIFPSAVGGISPALLAYGEKLTKQVDIAVTQALACHDNAAYILSMTELPEATDRNLYTEMLKERLEIQDAEVKEGGDLLVKLTPEAILEYGQSRMRVVTQQDLDVVYAKHILWAYGEGGEQADFSGCRLADLDMRHMQLNGANFTGALLENCRMVDAGLCFAVFRDAKLVGCDLNNVIAEETDFYGATFLDCKMRNGIYTHSNFAHTSFRDTDLWMSNFACCCVEKSNIMDTETEDVGLSDTSEEMTMAGMC